MEKKSNVLINQSAIQSAISRIKEVVSPATLASATGLDIETLSPMFEISIEEAAHTLGLLEGLELPTNARILEVGSGYGFASAALALLGFSVTALEPGGIGFETNQIISNHIGKLTSTAVQSIENSVETADFSKFQRFDVVISNNVLEHVLSVKAAIENLQKTLEPHGFMVHNCANYHFPFEPHFGIPLIPIFPKATSVLLPQVIKKSGLWKSLNFITATQVRRYAKKFDLVVYFRYGTMRQYLDRLHTDEQFGKRHSRVRVIANRKIVKKIIVKLGSIPVFFSTPMEFILVHDGQKSSRERYSYWQNLHMNHRKRLR